MADSNVTNKIRSLKEKIAEQQNGRDEWAQQVSVTLFAHYLSLIPLASRLGRIGRPGRPRRRGSGSDES
jgi:hypothetical protein